MPVPPGTRFGPYEVIGSLGAGGMGEVYRARDTRLGRFVAIKTISALTASDSVFRERFKREAEIISRLSHPAVCSLFDVGEHEGTPFLVMECLEGEPLSTRLSRGPMRMEDALHIAIQIADGVAHAHQSGALHRDLKPANVMLLDGERAKILDFGLARSTTGDATALTVATVSERGLISGTLPYMSPEQTMGAHLDGRSDIFSFGVMFYEMLTGVRAFKGDSSFEVMQQIVERQPQSAATLRPELPQAVCDLLDRLLAKSPAARPDAISTVANDLRDIASRLPALPRAQVSRPRRSWSRRSLTYAAVAAVVLVIGSIVLWSGVLPGPPVSGSLQSALDSSAQGRAYLRRYDIRGNADLAIDAFKRAIAADPKHAAAYAGLSRALLAKESQSPNPQLIKDADDAAAQALALNPDLASAHAARAWSLVRLNKRDEAAAEAKRALELDPLNVGALVATGDMHQTQSEFSAAAASYQKAADAFPDEWLPLAQLGRTYFVQSKYPDALGAWQEAEKRAPDNLLLLKNLGAVLFMLDRKEEAGSKLQRALEIEPTAPVYNNLGTLRFDQKRYSEAVAAFAKAVDLAAGSYLYVANLGSAYLKVPGSEDKAPAAYATAATLVERQIATFRKGEPTADLQIRLALYLAYAGNRPRALAALQSWESAASAERTPTAYLLAAQVNLQLANRDAALTALGKALTGGYPATQIMADDGFSATIQSDARFRTLLAPYLTSQNGAATKE